MAGKIIVKGNIFPPAESGMLNLDTYIVVSLLNRTLTAEEYRRIADEELGVSDIAHWELPMLANRAARGLRPRCSRLSYLYRERQGLTYHHGNRASVSPR